MKGHKGKGQDFAWLMQRQVQRAGTVQPGGKKVWGKSYQSIQILEWEGTKRLEPGFSQWCPVKQEGLSENEETL